MTCLVMKCFKTWKFESSGMLRFFRPVTSGNILIPIKTAFRTSHITNLKPFNFVFRFLAHKEHTAWRVFRVTLCLFTFIFKKKSYNTPMSSLRYWKRTWENYKNTFQFCSTPTHCTKANLMKPTSTTSVLGNLSYYVLDPSFVSDLFAIFFIRLPKPASTIYGWVG